MSGSRRSSRHINITVESGGHGYTTGADSSYSEDDEGEPSRQDSHEYGPSHTTSGERWDQHLHDVEPSDSASASADYDDPRYNRRPQSARPRSSSRQHRIPSGRQSYSNFYRAPVPPEMSSEPSDEFFDPSFGRAYAPPPPHGHAPYPYGGRGHQAPAYPAQSHGGAWPPAQAYGSSMVPFNMNPFSPMSANGGGYFERPPYEMVPFHQAPQNYYGGPGPGPGYGAHQLHQYVYGPPAPPATDVGPRAMTPAAPAERRPDPEVEAMKAKLEALEKERQRKEDEDNRRAMEDKIRRDTEEALQRRMEDIRKAQEEAKKEIEKAKADAERAARERIEAERRAEEERQRLHAEAMKRAERDAREKLEAEMKAMEERRKREAEAEAERAKQHKEALERAEREAREKLQAELRAIEEKRQKEAEAEAERKKMHEEAIKRAEEAAKAKMEAEFKAAEEKKKAEAEAQVRAEAEAKSKLEAALRAAEEAKEAAAKKAAEEVEWKKKLQEEANLKAEVEARTKLEKERKEAEDAAAAAAAKKKEQEALEKRLLEEAQSKAHTADKAPIKFKDAVGRKYSFPFHICKTWPGMEDLIKQAFLHVDVIGPHVQEGHYDLIGPDGEIILPSVWEKVIQPDSSITMHMWPMDKVPLRGQMHPGMLPNMPPGMRQGHPAGIRVGHPQHGRPIDPRMMAAGMRPATARPAGAGGMGVPPAPPHMRMPAGMGPPGGIPIRTGVAPVVVDAEPSRRKSKSSGMLMGWVVGKPSKSSGKKKHK